MHDTYARNAYRSMPEYFKDVIDIVLPKIDHGRVLDLGSHAMGHYWAIGYIERVESYSCYDLSQEALDIFQNTIDTMKPGDVEKNQGDLLAYLYEKNIIKAPVEEIEKQLANKLDTVCQFDFLKDKADRKFDIVLAMESLPVVDDFDQFCTALQVAHDFLEEGGLLLTVSGQYEKVTPYVEEMQGYKIEGRLNPSAQTFKDGMEKIGFRNIETTTIPVDFDDYLSVDICSAHR